MTGHVHDHGHSHDDDEHVIYNLNNALSVVMGKLGELDLAGQCANAGADYEEAAGGPTATLDYFADRYRVALGDGSVTALGGAAELSLRERVLLLHYLAQAKGTPPAGRLITYRDLPSGLVYYPTFAKRTVDQLVRHFGENPERLVAAAATLGGWTTDLGDTGIVIPAFRNAPITLVLWHGDEEFPATANLLFDANIGDFLEPEGVTITCEVMTWRLVRAAV